MANSGLRILDLARASATEAKDMYVAGERGGYVKKVKVSDLAPADFAGGEHGMVRAPSEADSVYASDGSWVKAKQIDKDFIDAMDWRGVKGLLYYTRFDNVSNLVDTALTGQSIDYKYGTVEDVTISGFEQNPNKFMYYRQNYGTTVNTDLLETSELESLTIEYFLQGSGLSGFGCNLDFAGTKDNFNSLSNRYLRISGLSSLSIPTFNGCQAINEFGNRLIVPFDLCPNKSLFHRAIVVKANNEQWHYVNGKLACINKRSISPNMTVRMGRFVGTNSTGLWFKFGNLAIWGTDKSINGGMEYPVPTSPYEV